MAKEHLVVKLNASGPPKATLFTADKITTQPIDVPGIVTEQAIARFMNSLAEAKWEPFGHQDIAARLLGADAFLFVREK
jgi:hypothetical protein